tara:strand:- start:4213 stop:6207 length:1995 start_codon:yes stop_codon:yes gene_type:complete
MEKFSLEEALKRGISAHKEGNIGDADKYYTAILKAHPDHPDANHNMGVLGVSVGKLEQSLPFFRKALEVNPKTAQFWLSYIHTLIKLRRFEEGVETLKEAKGHGVNKNFLRPLELQLTEALQYKNTSGATIVNPDKKALEELQRLYVQNKFEEALAYAEALKTHFPDSPTLLSIIGAIHSELKDYARAEESFEKAITLKPNAPKTHYNIAIVRLKSGQKDKAYSSFVNAVELKPDYVEALYSLATVANDLEKYDEAISILEKLTKHEANSSRVYSTRGAAFYGLRKFEAAIENYHDAITTSPDFAEAYNNLGATQIELKRFEAALLTLKKALLLTVDNGAAYGNVGSTLVKLGQYEKAFIYYQRSLLLMPKDPKRHNNLGLCLNELARNNEAAFSYRRAISLDPAFYEAYWNSHGLSKNIEIATETLKRGHVVNSNHDRTIITLAALKAIAGTAADFKALATTIYETHPMKRSYDWYFNLKNKPEVYFDRWHFFDAVIGLADKSRPFYEFGVWTATSFKYLMKSFGRGYGFDTFEGLPEDWHEKKAGDYSNLGVIPKIDGGEFIVGNFEDTLPVFFSEDRSKASIINFDADLYSSTICALKNSLGIIDSKTILVFDELIINAEWEQDEYRALEEFCFQFQLKYEVIAVSFFTKQVAVKVSQRLT